MSDPDKWEWFDIDKFDPGCNIWGQDKPAKTGWCYLLRAMSYYKIGITINVSSRLKSLQTASPLQIELICAVYGDARELETMLHIVYEEYRTHGEWFELDREGLRGVIADMKRWCWATPQEAIPDAGYDVSDEQSWLTWMDSRGVIHKTLRG